MPYSGDPSSSDRDAVRFLIGDTDADAEQLTDAEIDYLLEQFISPPMAALAAVDGLIAKYSRLVNRSIGSLRIDYGSRYKNYIDLRKHLADGIGVSLPIPYAGGLTVGDKLANEANTGRVQPRFTRGWQ